MHKQQAEEKRAALQEASAVDDMYEMLSVYEQKVPIGDQVPHSGYTIAQTFPFLPSKCRPALGS